MKLILFDIDGTLLHSGGAGARALSRAFHEVYRVEDAMIGIGFAGMTDPTIVSDVFMQKVGRAEREGERDTILEKYLHHLPEEMQRPNGARVLPGVLQLLEALAGRADAVLGLLTGNIERGARIKLGRFDLNRFFPFGGFASDASDRSDIARVARDRGFSVLGRQLAPADVIVIGDTPRDVTCGRAIDARVLAVATGPVSAPDLAPHRPDWLMEDLSDVPGVLGRIFG